MEELNDLFKNNLKWVKKVKKKNPNYFLNLATGQSPKYMWIGCSDSRVAAESIAKLKPGDIFVHRNVANLVNPNDSNILAGIEFALFGLNIRKFIICGHYGCGGVMAAEKEANQKQELDSPIHQWLEPLKQIINTHNPRVNLFDYDEKIKAYCEFNVLQQVNNLRNLDLIQNLIKQGEEVKVYGLIFDITEGKLIKIR